MRQPSTSRSRPGMLLIAALVVLAVLTILLTVVTVQIVKQRQFVQQRQRQLQADWLVRAGVELAAARLLASPAAFSAEEEELAPAAKVRIVVEKAAADSYQVSVEATVGIGEGPAVVRSGTRLFRRSADGATIRLQAAPAKP